MHLLNPALATGHPTPMTAASARLTAKVRLLPAPVSWTTPEPSNGAALYASDTVNPGECVFSQQVDIPAGAGESSFAGTVGANFWFSMAWGGGSRLYGSFSSRV